MEENKDVEEKSTQQIEKAIENDKNVVPYTSMSKMPPIPGGTSVALNLAGETLQAQFKVQEEIPDVDEYALTKLGYSSRVMLADKLSSEQIDATVLAIRQIEKGKGFILADMAGIGKGRVCASVLRYAYVKGFFPIFITEADNLFTAIYRDLKDIGGIGVQKIGNPFILNGYQNGGTEVGYDEKGLPVRIKKPASTSILDQEGNEIIVAEDIDTIREIVKGNSVPKNFDYMMLTYSQLSGERNGKLKVEFLLRLIEKLKGNVVVVMDECHNATGTTSSTGKAITEILMSVQGCLYSSATFSKRPENMFVYSYKTDIIDSPLDTTKLLELIKKGGERLIENLTSNLVLAQQMIRRERTYDNCDVDYKYMSDAQKEELFVKYDTTIKLYKKLINFFKSKSFREAKEKSVDRFAATKKVEMCKEPFPKMEGKSPIEYEKDIKDWESRNIGKYELKSFTAGEISRSTFNFVESLLFALKADFVANIAIEQLTNNNLENLNIDKTQFKSNRKPVIAVRNTLEGIFYYLGLKAGDEISKPDFSMYLYSMALSGLTGAIKIQEITKREKEKEKKKQGKIIRGQAEIFDTDFEDGGELFSSIKTEIDDVHLDIPLSPIDYVINKIQNTTRPVWEAERYERVTGQFSEKFRVGEVTGRNLCLVQKPNGKYLLDVNPKNKNKSKTFKQFNNGIFDVLLINESGSTGEDAHSRSDFGDTRPRVMIIHQVELDVATEVQKRGRINRTGMVNYPSYIYAVSRIPSEIRRLLMLAKKLRSLDASTSANQKQSAKLSTIKDSFGNPIEDITNKYGDECLIEFINCSDNDSYKEYMPTENQTGLGKLSNSFLIEQFTRNLELSICKEQEVFYDTINSAYISKTDELKDKHVYDLETNLMDLRASIKTRVLVQKGEDTNPFNSSVYEEEDYVLADDTPYEKQKVEDLVLELAKNEDPETFYNSFVEDYKSHFKKVTLKEIRESIVVPDYDLAKDKQEVKELKDDYEVRVVNAIENATKEYEAVLKIIDARQSDGTRKLKPNAKRVIPSIIEECYETGEDGKPIPILEFNNAKFVGVRILNTAKAKYSPMNIELIFCQLSGQPKLTLKPTLRGRIVLDWIINRDVSSLRIQEIERWAVDPNKRTTARLLTGNILGAFAIAKDRVVMNKENYSQVIDFLKFTTADSSSIRLGIKLNLKKPVALNPTTVPVTYAFNSKELLKDIMSSKVIVTVKNANEDFILKYDPANKIATIYLFGGNITPRKVKKYYSKLYDDGNLFDERSGLIAKLAPAISRRNGYIEYIPVEGSFRQKINVKGFTGKLPEAQQEIQEVIDYIYANDAFNVALRGIESEETIFRRPDQFKADGIQIELEREGQFAYETNVPIENIRQQLESLPKFEKIDKISPFGNVYFNRRANIREATSYGLIPLNSTLVDMVSDTFQSLTTDTERIKFQEEISKAIQRGDSDFNIGLIIDDTLSAKYIPLISIFGKSYDNLEYLGQVFRAYSKGEIELEKKEGELEEHKPYELPIRPLNIDTAQEYIILLAYKIKN